MRTKKNEKKAIQEIQFHEKCKIIFSGVIKLT